MPVVAPAGGIGSTGSQALAGRRFERPAAASGQRWLAALEELEALPALADAKAHLLRLLDDDRSSLEGIVLTIESDAALTTAVLRRARSVRTGQDAARASVPSAVRALGTSRLRALVEELPTFDFFDRSHLLAREAARLRIHAVAVQLSVQQIREELELGVSNTLVVAALLHDIGKIVLARAYGRHSVLLDVSRSPEERLQRERQALGIDHAVAGALHLRRLGLPGELAAVVEQHHASDAIGHAAIVQLADMLAHYAAGRQVDPGQLTRAANRAGVDTPVLRRLLQHPRSTRHARRPQLDPCPLTARQLQVIRSLRAGKSYKEIAAELGTSASTVRSHLHRVYATLGVVDRAQAVLLTSSRGWI